MKFNSECQEQWDLYYEEELKYTIFADESSYSELIERLQDLQDEEKVFDILYFVRITKVPLWLLLDAFDNRTLLESLGSNWSEKHYYDKYIPAFEKAKKFMITHGIDADNMTPIEKPSNIIHDLYTNCKLSLDDKENLKSLFSKTKIRTDSALIKKQKLRDKKLLEQIQNERQKN